MRVAAIVPWRDKGNPRRRANLRRVLAHLHGWGPPVHVVSDGRSDAEPFGRQTAYNAGMRAHPADVWVFHEADMLVDYAQLDAAVEAARTPGLVVPFSTRRELGPEESIDVAAGADPETYQPERDHPRSWGAVNVLSADTMNAVGQWDETLTGHGYDDTAMREAFHIATGQPARFIDGPGWHLWHPIGFSPWFGHRPEDYPAAEVEATRRNEARWRRYRTATTPEQVRQLTAGAP